MTTPLQQELRLLGELTNELKRLDDKLVARYSTHSQAVRLCLDKSRVHRSLDDWADIIGMNRSQFKQCISRDPTKHLPATAEEELQKVAGNTAIAQWRELYRNNGLVCQDPKAQEEAELIERLATIRAERGVA